MHERRCINCRFNDEGYCRRWPPYYFPRHNYGQWPFLAEPEKTWCGEFKRKPKQSEAHDNS